MVDIFRSVYDTVVQKGLVPILRTFIGFLTVQIPLAFHLIARFGKKDEVRTKQRRVRAKLTNEDDPSSAYRAVEVLDKLHTQPEGRVNTLAVIPDLCLQRHADKETMGVREILNVEEEKQSNGKVYRKVVFCLRLKQNFFYENYFLI